METVVNGCVTLELEYVDVEIEYSALMITEDNWGADIDGNRGVSVSFFENIALVIPEDAELSDSEVDEAYLLVSDDLSSLDLEGVGYDN